MKLRLAFVAFLLSSATAYAADLAATSPEPVAPVATVYNWTGFYVGAQVGYGWARDHLKDRFIADGDSDWDTHFNLDGALGGVHAGYNYQYGDFVFGAEGDIEAAGIKGSVSAADDPNAIFDLTKVNIPVQGGARLRVGYAFDRFLPYITGGVTIADIKTKYIDGGEVESFSKTGVGWTLGAGIEYAFLDNWTARLEYRYTDFGDVKTVPVVVDSGWEYKHRITEQTVRLGVSYKF